MTYNYDIILYEIMLNIYKLTNVFVFSFCLCNGFSSQIVKFYWLPFICTGFYSTSNNNGDSNTRTVKNPGVCMFMYASSLTANVSEVKWTMVIQDTSSFFGFVLI